MNRRGFLRNCLGITAGAAVSSVFTAGGDEPASARAPERPESGRGAPVVIVARDPAVAEGWEVDRSRLRDLLDRALCALSGGRDFRETLRALYGPGDVVGVKVNALAGAPAATHPELAFAVADALHAIGIERKNIIVWDRTGADLRRAGYSLNGAGAGYRCFGTDAPGVGYEAEHVFYGKLGSRLSRVLSSLTSAQVNVPVLKDHGLAGISGALKNYYGAIHNPNKYHGNHCDPWVADVNALPVVRQKSRLVVCDAVFGLCHGGPGFKEMWAWNFNGILVGTDPVAVDRIQLAIIEERRAELGLKSLDEEGRAPAWLKTAAGPAHRLGVSHLDGIERIDV